jgi:hypothetical protein
MKGRARKDSALLRLGFVQRRGSIFRQKPSQPRETEETSDQRHQIAKVVGAILRHRLGSDRIRKREGFPNREASHRIGFARLRHKKTHFQAPGG